MTATNATEFSPLQLDCPTCGLPIRLERRQSEGLCRECGADWHLYIETVPTLRHGPLVKEIDRKDREAAKAFVAPGT